MLQQEREAVQQSLSDDYYNYLDHLSIEDLVAIVEGGVFTVSQAKGA